jgi:phosphatidylglycerol:prolipoprotein diacylglycerol transferase
MIEIGMSPVLFTIGPLTIRWYGLMMALGVIVAVTVIAREAKRKGMDPDAFYSMAVYVLVAGLIGARAGHVIDRLDYYLANPDHIFAIQEGGLAIYGGLIAGLIAGLAYARIRHMPIGKTADVCALGLILGQAVGRLGCVVNGDAWGAPTNLPWGVVYTNPEALIPPHLLGVSTHPYAIYEIIWDLMVFAGLLFMRTRVATSGALFLTYALAYAVGRFFLTMVREEGSVLLGMQQAQVISVLTIVIVVPLLVVVLMREANAGRPSDQSESVPRT